MRTSAKRHLSSEWLEERLDLLGRFCLPSLSAQSTGNFIWALFCDEATDRDVLFRLREHAASVPDLRVILTSADLGRARVPSDIVDFGADVLITTRLDSDDAISDVYLESVQEYVEPFHRSSCRDLLVNFPHGYRLDSGSGKVFAGRMSYSPFHSLLERPKHCRVRTVMHGNHGRLHYEHLTQQDESLARWLIVVHGDNLINKVRDELPRVKIAAGRLPGFTLAYEGLAP